MGSYVSDKILIERIQKLERRLWGHGVRYDRPIEETGRNLSRPPPNRDRMFRLLMNKAELESELQYRELLSRRLIPRS